MQEETIAAVITAPGEAGVSIIRISGPKALDIADRVFKCPGKSPSRRPSHTVVYGQVIDEDKVIVESQQGDVLSDPNEISVATDKPTLVFRDWYQGLLGVQG